MERPLGEDRVPPASRPWRRSDEPLPESAILDGLGAPIIAVDAEWRIVHWSVGAERLTGHARAAMLGTDLRTIEPFAEDVQLMLLFREAMLARAPRQMRGWLAPRRRADGRAPLHDVRVSPIAGGGVVGLFVDADDRTQHDREIAERLAENEALRRLASRLAAVTDSASLLRLVCEAACDQCDARGASVLRVEGETCTFVGASGVLEGVQATSMPLAGTITERMVGRPPEAMESIAVERYHSDSASFNELAGRVGVGPMIVTPLLGHDQLLGVLSICRLEGETPFTERDRARVRVIADHASLALWKETLLEQTQAANEAKAKFLATISHELRTPLTALAGYGELLADEVFGAMNAEQHDAVERMRGVTQQLTMMIDEILAFTALDAGRERVLPRTVCPGDIITAASLVLEPLAERRGLRLDCEVPDALPPIVTDPDKARQILVNLGNNAVKFTEHGGVTLALCVEDGTVRFEVRDTGIGIPRDALPALFRPFSQLDTGLTRRHRGTGLGLYIARRLAEMLGGHIEVDSEVGQGSTFGLVLPRADDSIA